MALNTFSNGLRLVCVPKADKKIACVVLHIAGGTQSEKNYQSGISDYLTKIMFMGTKKHSTKEALMNYATQKKASQSALSVQEKVFQRQLSCCLKLHLTQVSLLKMVKRLERCFCHKWRCFLKIQTTFWTSC